MREAEAMSKIVIHHYPVLKLPADIRRGLDSSRAVKITIEQEGLRPQSRKMPRNVPPTEKEVEESVSRIRELRNEWEGE
jgi:hypothetical protein